MSSTLRHLTLNNGLRVSLRHAPHLKRCAAAVRVHAGSHDAPSQWPGLAHFLEHLFFLGSARFAVEDGLMQFVQRQGGQLNASTRERTTDFFFEVPLSALPGALERLCDMLAQPQLTLQRQQGEREVIHAEFIAWSRNAEAQRQFALLQSVSPRHPLSAFHAGNRYSLAIHDPAFQQALSGFHRRFYQAGQITLSLCGPQPLAELEHQARQFGALFAPGSRLEQTSPPALLDGPLRVAQSERQRDVLFAVDTPHLSAASLTQASDYLSTWITHPDHGGLLHELRQRHWLEDFSFTVLHQFAGQMLLHACLKLTATADAQQAEALLRDWLAFFRDADQRALRQEYQHLQQCRENSASALELARRDSASHSSQTLDEQGLQALRSVLDNSGTSRRQWRLPAAEPLLAATLTVAKPAPVPAGLTVSPLLPAARQYAALYLRWQLGSDADLSRWHGVNNALRPLAERAARAAVELHWSRCASTWQLRCSGAPAPLLAVLEQALALLKEDRDAAATAQTPLIPIRALMRQLPESLLGTPAASAARHLGEASWSGLATGFSDTAQNALNHLLGNVPGRPAAAQPPTLAPRQWLQVADAAGEPALLLFCPVGDEASGRLMAQLIQGPFYQRLRSELQLGYAVFSAYRQIQGHNGLLFGVQSPHASHAQILGHLRDFFVRPAPTLDATREALAAQFEEPAMANTEVAEWAWQTCLGGRQTTLDSLSAAIAGVDQAAIDGAWQHLASECDWLCLANGPKVQPY